MAHDPVAYLDKAWSIMEDLATEVGGEGPIEEGDLVAAVSQAQLWATMAQAAALLQPSPEEVISIIQETTIEVLEDTTQRAAKARQILQEATRDGSRRHPAIHAALEALGDG